MSIESEIDRIFALQQVHQWHLRTSTAEQRKDRLRRFREVLVKYENEIRDALQSDLGRPAEEPMTFELAVTLEDIDEAIENLDEWMKPVPVQTSAPGGQAYMIYEPRGVVLVFGSWNFPISLLLTPMVPMIAAGNCVIAKPNELTPASSAVAAKIIREAFDEREVAVFEGGVDVANALLERPFDHIFLTGSPAVGKIVMAAAAKHLASVTLELGGKCPAILDDSANLDTPVSEIGTGRMTNNGQTCLCVDYVALPEALRDRFVETLENQWRDNFYDGEKFMADRNSRMVNARNFLRVKGYIDDAVARGARVAFGGNCDEENLTIEPTILLDTPLDALVMQEEIFGPVLPIVTYRDVSEIYSFIRKSGKPLGMNIFSERHEFVEDVLRNTSSGGVSVNGWARNWPESHLPFGGVNTSGIGRYHSIHGFRELSHERAVFEVI